MVNKKISVLLVDDHPVFRRGLRVMLEEEGIQVAGEAGDGEEAVARTRELSPDVVVMDITMPKTDGIEATRRIVAEFPGVKVVPLSIHSGSRFVEEMLRAGAAGYVVKESAPEELAEAIRKVCGGELFLSRAVSGAVLSGYMRLLKESGRKGGDGERLTGREEELLRLIAEGNAISEIAADLGMSSGGVQSARRRLTKKLGLASVTELAEYAAALGRPEGGSRAAAPGARDSGDAAVAMPILATKLHPPGLPANPVLRPRLADRLQAGRRMPLVLVSAPAGFGKSTLVAHWLAGRQRPVAWVSLDEYDSLAPSFMRYLVAAVERRFPEACSGTDALLKSNEPVSPKLLATSFANELAALDRPLVLVLDDYQQINGPEVHDLMSELLAHPHEKLQIVVISRRDPPLPLARLRACDLVLEIRAADLQLSVTETGEMLAKSLGRPLDADLTGRLHELTEGWLVGLHLIALAARHQDDQERFLGGLHGNIRGMQDYLVEEVLERQAEDVQYCLLETSVTTRLNASFCREVCGRHGACSGCGSEMVKRLTQAGLPLAGLDGEGVWHRCHPVFREMLRTQLQRRRSAGELEQLHGRAARWLAGEGFADEAVEHAVAAGDPDFAATLVVEQRHDLINRNEWSQLERLLEALPPATVDADPGLLLARVWMHEHWFQHDEALPLAERAKSLVKGKSARSRALRAELDAFGCLHAYQDRDFDATLVCATAALKALPGDAHAIRAQVIQLQVFALQRAGRSEEAISVVFTTLRQDPFPDASYHAILLHALASIQWAQGEFEDLRRAATRCLEISKQFRQAEWMLGSHYFLGMYHYLRNELEEAGQHFAAGLDDRFTVRLLFFARDAFAQAYCHLACGRMHEARQLSEEVSRRAMRSGDQKLIERCKGFEVELALREGRLPAAVAWAKENAPGPLPASFRWLGPHLTWARVMAAEGRPEGIARAATHFKELEELVRTRHNRLQLIQVLNQHALLRDKLGEEAVAVAKLGESLELTEPVSCFRLMLDDGLPMADLLQRLSGKLPAPGMVRKILEAFGVERQAVAAASKSPAQPLIEPLTNRELDVLELIAKRLYDKEIADRLSISPGTVKSHLKHIYQKLDVGNRRAAVDRATSLGIVNRGE